MAGCQAILQLVPVVPFQDEAEVYSGVSAHICSGINGPDKLLLAYRALVLQELQQVAVTK